MEAAAKEIGINVTPNHIKTANPDEIPIAVGATFVSR